MPVGTMRRHRRAARQAAEERKQEATADESTAETTETTAPEATPLPESFPGYDELVAAGYESYESLDGLTQDNLVSLSGIGKVTANRILEALENR